MKKSILITGGGGYIGTSLVPLLLENNYAVTVYDSLIFKSGDKLLQYMTNPNFNFIKGDIRDKDKLSNAVKNKDVVIEDKHLLLIENGMNGLKARSRTLNELAEMSSFYIESSPIILDDKSKKVLNKDAIELLKSYHIHLSKLEIWKEKNIEDDIKLYCEKNELNLGKLAQPLRAATTGKSVSPGLYEQMEVLGKTETLKRIININN